ASATAQGATFNPTLNGYREIFAEDFPRWTFNTAFLSVAVMLLRLAFDSLAGYALARLKFPGNRLMFLVILGTLMIPGVVLIIPRFIMLKQLGMLNTYQGVIIPLMADRSEEHTSELQSRENLVCRLLLEKKKEHRLR